MSSNAQVEGKSTFQKLGHGLVLLLVILLGSWATAALYFDLRAAAWRGPAAAIFGIFVVMVLVVFRARWRGLAIAAVAFVCVLTWWLSLQPSNQCLWQPDVAQTAWAEINGNQITIHNLRNCDYRTETDYTSVWETRTVDLSRLRGFDVFMTYWGSSWIAHPIVSFDFGDQGRVAISVETRKQVGENYSAIRGFFRYYELIYTVADERDVVRLRTNYRTGEEVYLYHTRATPDRARAFFLDYLSRTNRMRDHAEWYNALTNNCTTNIASHVSAAQGKGVRWDWRILLNGKADEMMYEQGELAGDLPFAQLKEQGHINAAARAADRDREFSRLIREGRPGFPQTSERQ